MGFQGRHTNQKKRVSDPTSTFFFRFLKFELILCFPFRERNRSDQLPVFLHMHENEQGSFTSHSTVGRKKTKKPFIYITMTKDMWESYIGKIMYILSYLNFGHIINLKAYFNVKRIWILYFCVERGKKKKKTTYLCNATLSSVLLIKPNEQYLQVFISYPPQISLETHKKILLWKAETAWKWGRS